MRKKNSVTIADIAKKAGVSKTTVSFYLNKKFDKMSQKTREKIHSVIEEEEFVPNVLARSLNDKQSFLVGVMVQDTDRMEKSEFIRGVQDILQKNGYQIIMASTHYDLEEERQTIEKMLKQNVDGLIVNPSENFDLLWKRVGRSMPMVAWNPPHVSRYPLWVRSNDYEAAYTTLEQVIQAGYTRFVMVTEEDSRQSGMPQRVTAFEHATNLNHIESTTLYIAPDQDQDGLDYQLTQQVRIDKNTCFFVTSPSLLANVYKALRRYHELMPDRIGLIGFDSQEWSQMVAPAVTTIVQPTFEEGIQAGKLILDVILDKNRELPNQVMECRLVQGETAMMPEQGREIAAGQPEKDEQKNSRPKKAKTQKQSPLAELQQE